MARLKFNFLLAGASGKIGDLVIRQIGKNSYISTVPDMDHVVPTALQLKRREIFTAAVAYAKNIIHDVKLKAIYKKKVKKGERVYNFAIKEYYRKLKEGEV
jgi:hypothetical protein